MSRARAMSAARRTENYLAQTGRRSLTPRQGRRARQKNNRLKG